VVAMSGRRLGEQSQDLHDMPGKQENATRGSYATMGVAREALDHAGPFMGKMLLIVVHSKWIEVFIVPSPARLHATKGATSRERSTLIPG
jgi:hypothetical protein